MPAERASVKETAPMTSIAATVTTLPAGHEAMFCRSAVANQQ